MNVLRIANVPNNRTGGMSRLMHATSDALRARGAGVELAFAEELAVHARPALQRFVAPLKVVAYVRARLGVGVRYHAVEVHEPLAAAYALARRADRALPPLLVFSHGLEHRALESMRAYETARGVRRSLARRASPHSVIQQADLGLRLADQVALSTTEDRAWLVDRLGLAPERVTIVNGGVSDTFLHAPPPDPSARGVVFAGTWVERKGTADLVQAMTRVLARHPDVPFTCLGVGVAEDDVRARFPAHLRARVTVMPNVRGDDALLAVYRRHAVLAAPSVFEGQLLTMLEAAAAGLAIVATDRCGMKDFVRPGVSGDLVPVGAPDRLAAAIERFVTDPARARRAALAAQDDARAYTWTRAGTQLEAAFEAAIAHGRARA